MSAITRLSPDLLKPLLEAYPNSRRWVVAYSGGVDSHVLLHLCQRFLASQDLLSEHVPKLHAIHINHQLQSAADDWQHHCEQQTLKLSLPLQSVVVNIKCEAGDSLEQQARLARYQAFADHLGEGDLLLMGHHRDDQAETLLLRLMRGSGSQGLAAMPATRKLAKAHLVRPLLGMGRADIITYAHQAALQWVDDPSNQQLDFDRNFLRHQVLPQLSQRWPNYTQSLFRSAQLSAESTALNDELAVLDVERLGLELGSNRLAIEPLMGLSASRLRNILRYWLRHIGITMLSRAQLTELISAVIAARRDAVPELYCSGRVFRRHGGYVIVDEPLAEFDSQVRYFWKPPGALLLAGAGQLTARLHSGRGLRACSGITVSFRSGGEVIKPAGRDGTKTLKKLLQELHVPSWLRSRVPLLYSDNELIAVADLVIAEGWLAKTGDASLLLEWQRP